MRIFTDNFLFWVHFPMAIINWIIFSHFDTKSIGADISIGPERRDGRFRGCDDARRAQPGADSLAKIYD